MKLKDYLLYGAIADPKFEEYAGRMNEDVKIADEVIKEYGEYLRDLGITHTAWLADREDDDLYTEYRGNDKHLKIYLGYCDLGDGNWGLAVREEIREYDPMENKETVLKISDPIPLEKASTAVRVVAATLFGQLTNRLNWEASKSIGALDDNQELAKNWERTDKKRMTS